MNLSPMICSTLIPNLKSCPASSADPEDFFNPLEDTQSLNTFTKQDHLFARLEFLLQKGTVTLFLQEKTGGKVQESGVIQLEFAGQSPSSGQCDVDRSVKLLVIDAVSSCSR